MGTKLERISQLSRENPDMVFTSIGHLIDKELLKECHEKMDGKKAVGIDGVTKEEYSTHLKENLESQADAESRDYGRLPVLGYRNRFRARLRLFADHRKHIHALCSGVVVQGKDIAEGQRILWAGGVRG